MCRYCNSAQIFRLNQRASQTDTVSDSKFEGQLNKAELQIKTEILQAMARYQALCSIGPLRWSIWKKLPEFGM
jgi:hypothetical protein